MAPSCRKIFFCHFLFKRRLVSWWVGVLKAPWLTVSIYPRHPKMMPSYKNARLISCCFASEYLIHGSSVLPWQMLGGGWWTTHHGSASTYEMRARCDGHSADRQGLPFSYGFLNEIFTLERDGTFQPLLLKLEWKLKLALLMRTDDFAVAFYTLGLAIYDVTSTRWQMG